MRDVWKWVLGAVVAVAVLIPVGTWIYINVIEGDAPDKLTLDSAGSSQSPVSSTTPAAGGAASTTPTTATAATTATTAASGTYKPTSASIVGYRVKEVLFGQSTEAVGRTSNVDGALTIAGTSVETADISIDLASVTSDKSQRDSQFRGRIMSVSQYPTATFKLTSPIDLGVLPADGATVTVPATGALTLHGTTKAVTTTVTAKRAGGTIQVNGTIPVVFGDYGIPNPSFGPASTEDHGVIEFLVSFAKSNS
jgi:polyisoprenoid-binding protein YceI